MAIFSALQSRVQSELIDVPASLVALVPTWINAGIAWLQSQHNFQVMQSEAIYVTPAVSSTNPTHILGTIPSDWKCKREDPYFVTFLGTPYHMKWQATRPQMYRKWEAADVNQIGQPSDLLIGEPENPTYPDPDNPDNNMVALNIEFFPFSDGSSDWSDGNYRIHIPYFRYLPFLSAGTDQNWFTQDGPRAEFCVRYAVTQGFLFNEDEGRAAVHAKACFGARYDGSQAPTLGGWSRTVIDLDKGIMTQPARYLRMRRDSYASADQMRE